MALRGRVTQSLRLVGAIKHTNYRVVLPEVPQYSNPYGDFIEGGGVLDCHPDWADEFPVAPPNCVIIEVISWQSPGNLSYFTRESHRVGNTIYGGGSSHSGSFSRHLQPSDYPGFEPLNGPNLGAYPGDGYVGGEGYYQTPTSEALAGFNAWINSPRQPGDQYILNVTGGPQGAKIRFFRSGTSVTFQAVAPAMDIPLGAGVEALSVSGNVGDFPLDLIGSGSTPQAFTEVVNGRATYKALPTQFNRWPEIGARPQGTGYADPAITIPNVGFGSRLLGASARYNTSGPSAGTYSPTPAFTPSDWERTADWVLNSAPDPAVPVVRATVSPPSPQEAGVTPTLDASTSENVEFFSFDFADGTEPIETTQKTKTSSPLLVPGDYQFTVRGRSFSGPVPGPQRTRVHDNGAGFAGGVSGFFADESRSALVNLAYELSVDLDFAPQTPFPGDRDGFTGDTAPAGIDQEIYAGSLLRMRMSVPGHYSGEFTWQTGRGNAIVDTHVGTSYIPRLRSPNNVYPYFVIVYVGEVRGFDNVFQLRAEPFGVLVYQPRVGEAVPVVIPYEVQEPFTTPLNAAFRKAYDLAGRQDGLRIAYGTPR